ncbi:hypothetical protein [Methanobrevibacter sp.]|uniref:hypothetical protein n=1 Tax=Methanobrevibacter sp. TaxID=66852 RepID=UPI00388FEEFA
MDKRVIMIIAILIVGISCMYVIVDHSDTIGNAITTFSKTSVTLPNGFSVGESNAKSAELYNKQSNEKIDIHDQGKGNHTENSFKNVTESYKNNPDYSNFKNETKNINGVDVFQLTMEKNNTISSSSVFYHYNHTYRVDMSGFSDLNKLNKDLEFIITTLQPDYKQAQD